MMKTLENLLKQQQLRAKDIPIAYSSFALDSANTSYPFLKLFLKEKKFVVCPKSIDTDPRSGLQ